MEEDKQNGVNILNWGKAKFIILKSELAKIDWKQFLEKRSILQSVMGVFKKDIQGVQCKHVQLKTNGGTGKSAVFLL